MMGMRMGRMILTTIMRMTMGTGTITRVTVMISSPVRTSDNNVNSSMLCDRHNIS